jgi:hypothetical protein
MQTLLRALSVSTVLASLASLSAFADDANPKAVWGGGPKESSAYSGVYVPQVVKVLNDLNLTGYDWGGVSQGTVDNAERVTDHPTNLAVGQADILSLIQGKPIPGRQGDNYQFTVLQKSMGPECLYLISPKDKNYKTWGDFLADAWQMNLVTAGEKSGSFGTWKVLQSVFPEALNDLPVKHVADNGAILGAVKDQKDTVGFFVMRPDPDSDVFKTIADGGLKIVPVVDFELEGKYDFKSLKVASGWTGGTYVQTACTAVELIAGDPKNPKLVDPRDKRRVDETIKRVSSADAKAFRPDTSSFADMWDSIAEFTGDKAKELMQASKESAAKLVKHGG